MASTITKEQAPLVIRHRKTHRKSRLGCGNCKLRSIKCDETKPTCNRCFAAGFACNFSRSVPSLQLELAGAFKIDLSPGLPAPLPRLRIPVALPVSGKVGEYEMTASDFAALERFRTRTVMTVGSRNTRHLYREGAFDLGLTVRTSVMDINIFHLICQTHLMTLLSMNKVN
ncbi:hypothetical protein G7046_g9299 [Stylonectria norvegica]|nr:hypothetical protein G7046_g9299 [Stylonectria norvegica]